MQINARVDIRGLADQSAKAQKNLLYATVQGLRKTATMIQDAERKYLSDHFTLRGAKTDFLLKQVAIIKPQADVRAGRLWTEIAVGQRKGLLLSGYETGADRPPAKGTVIAQPVTGSAARPSFSNPVTAELNFKAMKLKAKKAADGSKYYKGQHGTYTVAGVGVFMRTGRARDATELIYGFHKEQKLPKKLGWERRAQDIANRWLEENITQAWLRAKPSGNVATRRLSRSAAGWVPTTA